MQSLPDSTGAEPFFLKTTRGERYALYHAPDSEKEYLGAVIFVHPFAEEMNKSRRMVALQARAFAALGIGVLQIDLFGCGDSEGEFRGARWQIWKDDLRAAQKWLIDRNQARIRLWGLRLGALLALDFAKDSEHPIEEVILWQPVVNGEAYLTQFLRLRLAADMLSSEGNESMGTGAMRNALWKGEYIEVGGYEIAPGLAQDIDCLRIENCIVRDCPVHWFEMVSEVGRTMPIVASRVAAAWGRNGIDVHIRLVQGPSFWLTQEIAECPELLSLTSALVLETQL